MRIISGKFKNKLIATSEKNSYRPTTSKLRGSIFSILTSGQFQDNSPLDNANVLDLFTGSGALVFEALSRGAKKATLVDINKDHISLVQKFVIENDLQNNVELVHADATKISLKGDKFNLVFIDPPYNSKLIELSLINLLKNNILEKSAIIIIETAKFQEVNYDNFELLFEKIYGNKKLIFLKYG